MSFTQKNYEELDVLEFLKQSNYIEGEKDPKALQDAMKAWRWAIQRQRKIDVEYVLKIHEYLAKRVRPDIAGKIRHCEVSVGGRKGLVSGLIPAALLTWVEEVGASISLFKDVRDREHAVKQLHVEFEKIHPFEDYNGRTGRILYNIHRLKIGLEIDIICASERVAYYQWFK